MQKPSPCCSYCKERKMDKEEVYEQRKLLSAEEAGPFRVIPECLSDALHTESPEHFLKIQVPGPHAKHTNPREGVLDSVF